MTTDVAELFLDEEGNNHGKDGVLCTIQVTFASMIRVASILDIVALGPKLFPTVSDCGLSLKCILEDSKIFKCLFDIRNDNAALLLQYGVKLEGTVDLQIMELTARTSSTTYCSGLARCINSYLNLNEEEKQIWNDMKNKGGDYYGDDYPKWVKRPLPNVLHDYVANDTIFKPHLYSRFFTILQYDEDLMHLVWVESARRVHENQKEEFKYSGAFAPSAFQLV